MTSEPTNKLRAKNGRSSLRASGRAFISGQIRNADLFGASNFETLTETLRDLMHAARDTTISIGSFHDALTIAQELFAEDLSKEFTEGTEDAWPFPVSPKGDRS